MVQRFPPRLVSIYHPDFIEYREYCYVVVSYYVAETVIQIASRAQVNNNRLLRSDEFGEFITFLIHLIIRFYGLSFNNWLCLTTGLQNF